jgi:hypothetical protein
MALQPPHTYVTVFRIPAFSAKDSFLFKFEQDMLHIRVRTLVVHVTHSAPSGFVVSENMTDNQDKMSKETERCHMHSAASARCKSDF